MSLRIDLKTELQVRQVRLIVKRLDETFSLLYNGFRDREDHAEGKKTLARITLETSQILKSLDAETDELLEDLKETE